MTWVIRYLSSQTRESWLTGRPVLLSPHALGQLNPYESTLQVNLHKETDSKQPLPPGSNPAFPGKNETGCCRYYGWPAYWEKGTSKDLTGQPEIQPASPPKTENRVVYRHLGDKHLQSTQTITDYQIQTIDGVIGSVIGFMVDVRNWTIRELIVETGHWFAGREIMISPTQIQQINCEYSSVLVNLTKEDIFRTATSHYNQIAV